MEVDAAGHAPIHPSDAIPYLRGPVREAVSRVLKYYEVEGYEHGLPSL
ncbi:hypothetical protein ACF09C_17780 [Streptomyces sp. NPDC014870]